MSDSAVTGGRSARASGGIVVAGDRTLAHGLARRHSRVVQLMKLGLPCAAVATVAIYAMSVMNTAGFGDAIAQLEVPKILPENLTMDNPHYEGFTKDGGKYVVDAKTAQQDLRNFNLIRLNDITGELTDTQKLKTKLTATRGEFDNKANQLELYDSIDVVGDNGMTARLTRASVDTKENIIKSDEPVEVAMTAGTIKAEQMTARQKAKEYTFTGSVETALKGRPGSGSGPAAGAKQAQQPFGSSGEPVNITSNRLDINDTAKVAIFTGTVRAVQGQGTLTTPELEVSYDGAATPGAAATTSGAENGKVKRIVAKAPVSLDQGAGQTVTSQLADFDTINKRAVLEGSVVMTELPDKRATSDRADIDQTANTVLLSGNVVVTQGQNELKGRRLYFDRLSNKMQLTSPPTGAGPGRIAARFAKSGVAPANQPETDATPTDQGFAMTANFKTDPNAPISVEADRLDVDDRLKQAVFTGTVYAKQADFALRAAEMTATYSGSASLGGATDAVKGAAAKLSHLKARKNVEVTGKDGNAKGDWADFDIATNKATLGGNVILNQGKSVLRGTRLVIDMTTGQSSLTSDPEQTEGGAAVSSSDGSGAGIFTSSGRPSATFIPGEVQSQNQKQKSKPTDGWSARSSP